MAAPDVDIATGITIVCETSGFTAEVEDVHPASMSRESIQTSHQGTTGGHTYEPADLYDPGELVYTIHFNPETDPPIDAAAESIVITFPDSDTWTGTGFMTNYSPHAPFNDKMVGDVTFKWSGDITSDIST